MAVESKDPIILTLHDWTGQLINTELMGRILENMGYNVKVGRHRLLSCARYPLYDSGHRASTGTSH